MSIRSLTAVQLGKKIQAGEVTVREAVEASLAQIDSVESEVHSYVTICREEALKRADQVQKMIDAGELTGPLAGVPVAITTCVPKACSQPAVLRYWGISCRHLRQKR